MNTTLTGNNIETKLPILCFDNGCLISKFADITVALELELPEIYSSGQEDFEQYHETWVRALRILPAQSIIHKQDFFIEEKFLLNDDSTSFLSKASNIHFKNRRYLNHKCYLYITLSSKKNLQTTSLTSIICRNRVIPSDMLDQNKVKDFLDNVEQFIHILSEKGIQSRKLTEEELIGSPSKFGLIENYLNLDFKQKSCLQDLHINGKDFLVGDKYVNVYSISELDGLPSEVQTHRKSGNLSSESSYFAIGYPTSLCLQLPFNHIYNQYFFLDDEKEKLANIEKRGREQLSLSRISRENAINKEFNDNYLNEAVINSRRPVRCAFNITFWDTDYARLLKKSTMVGARLANMDCTGNKTEQITANIFWGGIPGGSSQYPSEMTFLTFLEQGACFINNETNARSSETGFGLRLCDRVNGVPITVDISDEPQKKGWIDNRNKFIVGPSGSGKSFFTNHMVRQYYEQGTHVVIVDVGDSYYGLCKLIHEESNGKDGIYYTYTEEKPITFNPFYTPDGVYSIEKLDQLKNLILVLSKNEGEKITKAEETHIEMCVDQYINAITKDKSIRPCFDSFYVFLRDVYKEYIKEQGVRRENFDIDNFIQILRPYAKGGKFETLLNAKENIDLLQNKFIVFEIDNIKDHKTLFPVVTLILMDTFISKMRHESIKNERKMILIEEAWKAISKANTAEFIKYLYKTVRKHFGEAIVVTQEIDDIINNPIVKESIISNADCKILLDQRKYANRFTEVQEILSLNDKEKAIALSVNRDITNKPGRAKYKEVFITLNGNHTSVYGTEVSKAEYLVYTTEKTEKVKVLDAIKKTGSIRKGITLLTS